MKNSGFSYALSATIVLILGASLLAIGLNQWGNLANAPVPQTSAVLAQAQSGAATVVYNPPKLEDAPANIRDAVTYGYNIISNTQQYAKDYVGNQLNCTNCHFSAGITQGGENGGIPLVGVGAKYPMYRDRTKYATSLELRTNECFQRSLNGKAPAFDSKEMQAILAYYQWISKDIPIYAQVPWLGLSQLSSSHQGDKTAGGSIFAAKCTPCHGTDGAGTNIAPPVWGNQSFNDGAGMANAATLASFIKLNMPKGNPTLSTEEAIDVATFVDGQPRPHFQSK